MKNKMQFKLNKREKQNVRKLYKKGWWNYRELAKKYDVSKEYIGSIIRNGKGELVEHIKA